MKQCAPASKVEHRRQFEHFRGRSACGMVQGMGHQRHEGERTCSADGSALVPIHVAWAEGRCQRTWKISALTPSTDSTPFLTSSAIFTMWPGRSKGQRACVNVGLGRNPTEKVHGPARPRQPLGVRAADEFARMAATNDRHCGEKTTRSYTLGGRAGGRRGD